VPNNLASLVPVDIKNALITLAVGSGAAAHPRLWRGSIRIPR
jgi:hypothetical protein